MEQAICRVNGIQRTGLVSLGGFGCACVLVLAIGVGCKPEAQVEGKAEEAAAAAGQTEVAGLYRLVEVDGKEVPCAVEHDGHGMTIQEGSFRIGVDGTCESKMVLAGREQAIERKATYTRAGTKLTMKWEGFGRTVGTVEGETFRMDNEGMVLTYRK